jgi:hypothetical protein
VQKGAQGTANMVALVAGSADLNFLYAAVR